MKTLLTLGATALLSAGLGAQTQLPASADLTVTPGATPVPVVTAPGARATTACDDFNRATGLGADWAPAGGSPGIFNDMFGSASGNAMAQHTSASVAYDSAAMRIDLPQNVAGLLTYGAVAHGLGGASNLFTKVQSQGGTSYNYLGYYAGFNGPTGGLGGFQAIPVPFLEGWVDFYVTNSGDQMNIDIDENRDGVVDYQYFAGGCTSVAGMGMAVGIGAYGSSFGSADDWELNQGCGPVGPSLALVGTCPGLIGVDIGGMTAGGNVAIVAGIAGSFNVPAGRPCAGTDIGVNPLAIPLGPVFFVVPADGNGEVNIGAVGNAGPAACGLISVVAIDLTTCAVTNVAAL